MKKKKINMKKYADMHEEKEFTGADGTVIQVRNHIPYAEKEQMARELAENMLIIHDDSCVYTSEQYDRYEKFMIAKYYTSINTDGADEAGVADFLINNGLYEQVEEYIFDDFVEACQIFHRIEKAVTKTYEDDRSVGKALRTSFGFLFNGEDITESLAKAEITRDTMFKALDALNKKEKEESEKMNNGKLNVGGNIISFAKRD